MRTGAECLAARHEIVKAPRWLPRTSAKIWAAAKSGLSDPAQRKAATASPLGRSVVRCKVSGFTGSNATGGGAGSFLAGIGRTDLSPGHRRRRVDITGDHQDRVVRRVPARLEFL